MWFQPHQTQIIKHLIQARCVTLVLEFLHMSGNRNNKWRMAGLLQFSVVQKTLHSVECRGFIMKLWNNDNSLLINSLANFHPKTPEWGIFLDFFCQIIVQQYWPKNWHKESLKIKMVKKTRTTVLEILTHWNSRQPLTKIEDSISSKTWHH